MPDGKTITASVITHTPATPVGGIEAELRIFEPLGWGGGYSADMLSDVEGGIGLFYGGYGESPEAFRELHTCGLEALLFVETDFPVSWEIANGMGEKFMDLVRKPMLNLALMDAWELGRHAGNRVCVKATGSVEEGQSRNVTGELRGSAEDGDVIVVCAHLDSVSVGHGADDDASGLAAMLEIARRQREIDDARSLRFIGFGAEEQLSVGATRYVLEQIEDLPRIRFVCNLDSLSARMGVSRVIVTGTPELEGYVRGIVEEKQRFASVESDAVPYQDEFAFARFGIPGLWYTRQTHCGSKWYHHSVHNTLDNCSVGQIVRAAASASELIGNLRTLRRWPFPRGISAGLQERIRKYTRDLFV